MERPIIDRTIPEIPMRLPILPNVAEPVEQTFTFGGLEQQIRIAPMSKETDPEGKWFVLSSRIINRSDVPVAVVAVTCWLDPDTNLRTRAEFSSYAIPSCPGPNPEDDNILDPGESTRGAWFAGSIERPGRYTIQVRQALDPEFWGEVTVVAR
jgi:hypothetical protein